MAYSVLEADLRLKEELRDAFFEAFDEECERRPDGMCNLFRLFRMDDTSIYFNDTFALWTGEERFVRFIAPFVEEGRLVFKCRDGTAWGYWFDGQGNVKRIEFIERLEEGYFFQPGTVLRKTVRERARCPRVEKKNSGLSTKPAGLRGR